MFCLFDKNHTAKLNIFSDEISVRKACGDFLRDLIYISGNENFNRLAEIKKAAAHLTNCTNGGSGVLTITQNPALSGPEAYEITITDSEIAIAGSDSLGIIYGISAFGLSQRLDCPRGEAAALIESYFTQFPGVKAYMEKLVTEATEKGYAETLCGRRRNLPDLRSANANLRAAAERTAINTPIQGSAADMIKIAMVRVAELLKGRKSRMMMQIHDELLIDLHEDEQDLVPRITETMRRAMPLPHGVPLEVEANTAPNWLDAH